MKKTLQLSQNSFRNITLIIGVGLAFGVLTLLGQATLPGSWNHFANSGAVWLVAAFIVGLWMPSITWAMMGGFISLIMALLGYTAVITVIGLAYPFSTIAFWGAIALVGGPVFGLAGQWWRYYTIGSWRHATGAALMGGVFIAEGWYMLTIIHDALAGWVSIIIGILLAILLPHSWKDRFRSLAALIPIVLLGMGAFALLALLATTTQFSPAPTNKPEPTLTLVSIENTAVSENPLCGESVSVSPTTKELTTKTYSITLQYPADWECDNRSDSVFGYSGKDGFFQLILEPMMGPTAKGTCETQVQQSVGKGRNLYGANPTMDILQVDNQPACLVSPSDDQPEYQRSLSLLVVEYPKLDKERTRLLLLFADKNHIREFMSTLKFAR